MPTKIKTNRKVRSKKLLEVPTAWLSIVCRCSPDLIRRYRRGSLTGNGNATSRIRSAEELLSQKIEALLLETGAVVNHTPKSHHKHFL